VPIVFGTNLNSMGIAFEESTKGVKAMTNLANASIPKYVTSILLPRVMAYILR